MKNNEISCSQIIMKNFKNCLAEFPQNISVSEEYRFGYSEDQCIQGLRDFYLLINDIYSKAFDNPELFDMPVIYGVEGASGADYMKSYHSAFRIPNLLCTLGSSGSLIEQQNEISLLIDGNQLYQMCEKMKPKTPERLLLGLENVGLICDEVICNSKTLKLKDLKSLLLRCTHSSNALLGLKVFSHAVQKFDSSYFVRADMRITSNNATENSALNINHLASSIPQFEMRDFVTNIHNVLLRVGCKSSIDVWVDRANWKAQYSHSKLGKKVFATVFVDPNGVTLKLNLRNLGNYESYLEFCPETLQKAIIHSFDCSACNGKECVGGIKFRFNNIQFGKCNNESFRFNNIEPNHVEYYKKFIELEASQIV